MAKLDSRQRVWNLFLLAGATLVAASGQTYNTLVSFAGANGAYPLYGSLIMDAAGNLYGTTSQGGAYNAGTVFEVTPNGALTTLYSFCVQAVCADGSNPWGWLVGGADGNFYGTTASGGTNGDGTIFKLTPGGALTTLHNFDGPDGANPYALILASDGNFYGTAPAGGAYTYGTVYKMTPNGAFTTLYSFCALTGCPDGEVPSGLVEGTDGNFYGTTQLGGVNQQGTVFRIAPGGSLTTLYNFCASPGCPDGMAPSAALIQATDGNFYGTTSFDPSATACQPACGTVFKITPAGALTTLHTFALSEGAAPSALIQGSDGNFYGTVQEGGALNDPEGAIYEITPAGVLTILYGFPCSLTACTYGANPNAALVQGANGVLFGTTLGGGAGGDGVVFSLALGPPGTLSINASGVVNAADYVPQVAPGSIASAFGNFLLASPLGDTGLPLSTNLGGLSLAWSSICAPEASICPEVIGAGFAPLFYASGSQVNLQIPWEMGVTVSGQLEWQNLMAPAYNGQSGNTQPIAVAPFAPAIFTTGSSGTGPGAILDASYRLVDSTNPASGGSYILIYCTGLGAVTNQPATGSPALGDPLSWTTTVPTVTIGGNTAPVSFYGLAPGYVGLYQVNAQVPAGMPANASTPVLLSIGGVASNTVTMAVQ